MAERDLWDLLRPIWVDRMGATAWDPPNLPLFEGAPWPNRADSASASGTGQPNPFPGSSGYPSPLPPEWPQYVPGPAAPQSMPDPKTWTQILNILLSRPRLARNLSTAAGAATSDFSSSATDSSDDRGSESSDIAAPPSYAASSNEPLSSFELAQAPQPPADSVGAAPLARTIPFPKPRPRQAPQLSPAAVAETTPWLPKISGFAPAATDQPFDERWSQRGDMDRNVWLRDTAAAPPRALSEIQLPNLQTYGIDPDDLLSRIIRSENAEGNPSLRNLRSSATGLGQITDDTWPGLIKEYRPDLFDWWSSDQKGLLELRTDPQLSRQMTIANADKHVKELAAARLPVTHGTIYLAHHFGFGGAKKILTADPNELAINVISHGAVRDNQNVITPTTTIGQLMEWADDRMQYGPRPRQQRR